MLIQRILLIKGTEAIAEIQTIIFVHYIYVAAGNQENHRQEDCRGIPIIQR